MKNTTIITATTAAVAGFAATLIGLAAPAAAAPAGGSAADTISSLEADGNRVIVNRQSSTPLSEAGVTSVRQGQPIREYVWDAQGDDQVREITGHVYFVDVN
ncbi:hypothetical protein [Mycolicibacterium hippocampi]|jgi:hypothetical protein|uniref:Uncharacterized protein n=2 Tax=Mycolicibacterium hippocampi TaxID=659824 RepID=A0A850PFT0_9MYCO|nr:hypothetical protein [Mycolicibacterium hippocampi]NVN49108.1 hypothetical protein [Mycolicibacterium hippocampi]